jgi:hypothetical protein
MRLDVTKNVEAVMGVNLWFEDIVDAYLEACAEGRDWREACAAAEQAAANRPRRVLTQKGLRSKGLEYTRQHIAKKVRSGTFPPPFQLPDSLPVPRDHEQQPTV